jgi:hypothetical protein
MNNMKAINHRLFLQFRNISRTKFSGITVRNIFTTRCDSSKLIAAAGGIQELSRIEDRRIVVCVRNKEKFIQKLGRTKMDFLKNSIHHVIG